MVELTNIQKKYGKKSVLSDISFQIPCGQIVALIGKNGCGKSTLLQIMAGVLRADAGSIYYYGKCVTTDRKAAVGLCGYVPQENPLIEELSVRDNLRLWGGKKQGNFERLIKEFGLDELLPLPVEKLSGGVKRRLSIACALINEPSVLLLDEPTTALDIYYQQSIQSWMQEYRKRQGIIFMATHNMAEILEADRCFLMQEGRIRELSKEEIKEERIKEVIITA